MKKGGCDIFTGTEHPNSPSLSAGDVPGSAEANGGLQKTHCCEKRLRVELDLHFLILMRD